MPSPSRAQKLVEELRALSEEERVDVIAEVLPPADDDADDMDPAWREELERRLESVVNGTAQLVDFEESYKRLLAKFPPK